MNTQKFEVLDYTALVKLSFRSNIGELIIKRGRINGVRKHSGYFGEYLYFAYGYVLYR